LEYLHSTLFDGPYKDMWKKWESVERRPQSSQCGVRKGLPLRTLTKKVGKHRFRGRTVIAVDRHLNEENHLRKKDERRHNIEHSMKMFGERYLRGVTRAEIEEYCKYISRYVSRKTI
uniref:Polyprotein n=1 Tax=Haemonchus placei TaxID=6290 RepID=A0A0N4W3T5_HAEPC